MRCRELHWTLQTGTAPPALIMYVPSLITDMPSVLHSSLQHFWDELLSNVCQLPSEGIHARSTCICTLVTQCKFAQPQTQEMLKIMVLLHAVQYHEARDWIWLQDQFQLTYPSLLAPCKLLKSWCEQYQKAKERG